MTVVDQAMVASIQSLARDAGNGQIRFSGMTARDLSGDVRAQTRDVLALVDEQLSRLGLDRRSVLMVHIWLSDMSLFQGMTSEWNNWIGDLAPPSRSCVSGTSVISGALLEVEVIALSSQAVPDNGAIQRYGLVRGPGRPTMCLALGHGNWFTVCTLASDCSVGVTGQTRQILDVFDTFMNEAGIARSAACKLEVWLKDIQDHDVVQQVLAAWFAPAQVPAISVVGANMARPDMLIEIRLTATT